MVVIRILKTRSKGNRKESQKRRRNAHRDVIPLEDPVLLIDGNCSKYVVGYCTRRKAYLTRGLAGTHNCEGIHCVRFRKVKNEDKEVLSS